MWYLVGIVLFLAGMVCMLLAGPIVLEVMRANERHGLSWHEGGEGWVIMEILGFVLEVVGFVVAFGAA